MLVYVPISFVFQHMVCVDVLESVLDRSPYDSLGNVRKPLECIHGNGVPDLLFAEDYYNQKDLSLLFSLLSSFFLPRSTGVSLSRRMLGNVYVGSIALAD